MEEARQHSAVASILLKAWWYLELKVPFDGYSEGIKEFEFNEAATPKPVDVIRIECLREIAGLYTFMGLELLAASHERGLEDVNVQRKALASLFFNFSAHVQSILLLLERGLDAQARVLARTVIEILEYQVLVALDANAAREFILIETADQSNHFWFKWASKGKVRKRIESHADFDLLRERYEEVEDWRSNMAWASHPSHLSGTTSIFDYDSDLNLRELQYFKPWAFGASSTIACVFECWALFCVQVERIGSEKQIWPLFHPPTTGSQIGELLGSALAYRNVIIGRIILVGLIDIENGRSPHFESWVRRLASAAEASEE